MARERAHWSDPLRNARSSLVVKDQSQSTNQHWNIKLSSYCHPCDAPDMRLLGLAICILTFTFNIEPAKLVKKATSKLPGKKSSDSNNEQKQTVIDHCCSQIMALSLPPWLESMFPQRPPNANLGNAMGTAQKNASLESLLVGAAATKKSPKASLISSITSATAPKTK